MRICLAHNHVTDQGLPIQQILAGELWPMLWDACWGVVTNADVVWPGH